MIDLQGVVWIVLYLLIAGGVLALLIFLINYVEKQFPGESMSMFAKFARIVVVVLGVLILIGILIGLITGEPIVRWGGGSGRIVTT